MELSLFHALLSSHLLPNGSASIKEVCNAYRVSYMDKFDFKELIKMHRKIERKMSDIKNKATVLALISNPPYPNGTSCTEKRRRSCSFVSNLMFYSKSVSHDF